MSIRRAFGDFSARHQRADYLLTVLTALLLLLMFVIAPLRASGIEALDIPAALIAIAMVFGVLLLSANLVASVFLFIAFAVSLWVVVLHVIGAPASQLHVFLTATAWLILSFSLGWPVARAVFAPGRVTYHRIIGAVLLYLLIATIFVSLFTFIGLLIPNSFSGLTISDSPALGNALTYFSIVTLTTVGYGDILPVHPIARSLCNLESIIGQFYTATLLARLMTLHSENQKTSTTLSSE
jgi:hypothetical protein